MNTPTAAPHAFSPSLPSTRPMRGAPPSPLLPAPSTEDHRGPVSEGQMP
jgi:hypothetical protein